MSILLLLASMAAGQSADALTTCRALGSGRFAESNGILPGSCGGIVAVKGASLAGATGIVMALRHHPKLARVVAFSWTAAGVTAAAINAHRMR